MKRGLNENHSGNEVYFTASSSLVISKDSCSKLHCQKGFSIQFPFHAKSLGRAFAVKVDTKRLPVFLFSGVDLYHDFRNDAFCDLYNL